MRVQKWTVMLENWDRFCDRNRKKLKSRCRKGIPDSLRGTVWPRLVGADRRRAANPQLYDELLRRPVAERDPVVDMIERDIARTFPRQELFRERGGIGQIGLFRVLRAYAAHDPTIGYCQGMGFIAALFLTYMPEEEAFWLLLSIMQFLPHRLADLFAPGLPQVPLLEFQLQELTKRFLPKLAAHLEHHKVAPTMYSAQWFLTVFTYSFPLPIVVRVWDVFLAEGWKVIFRVAVAALKAVEPGLLAADSFEGIMMEFRELPKRLPNADELFRTAFGLNLKRKHLIQLATAYKGERQRRLLREAEEQKQRDARRAEREARRRQQEQGQQKQREGACDS